MQRMFTPHPVVAQLPAMIAPQDNDRIIGQARLFQCIQHFADLGIHIADTSKISVADFTGIGVGKPFLQRCLLFSQLIPVELSAIQQRRQMAPFRNIRRRRQRDGLFVIHIPIFLWSRERQVRLEESYRQTERLSFPCQFLQFADSQISCQSVGQAFVRDVGTFVRFHLPFFALPVRAVRIAEKGIPSGLPLSGIEKHLIPAVG